MQPFWKGVLALVAVCSPLQPAEAISIVGHATSMSGDLRYEGLGDLGDGVSDGRGTGLYSIGPCAFAGGLTTCTLSGAYVEDAGSVSPGATGTFEFRTIWLGSGANPIIARSDSPGSSVLQLFTLGSGHFELELFPTAGGSILGLFPDVPFSDSVVWNGFLGPAPTCTGAPSACTIGQVGLSSGAVVSGPLSDFFFQLPQPVAEPTSATLVLPALAIALLASRRR